MCATLSISRACVYLPSKCHLTNTHKIVEEMICHQLAMNKLSTELGMSLTV